MPRKPAIPGSSLTAAETDAVVKAYFDLLDQQEAGRPYDVAAARRSLLEGPLLGRKSVGLHLQTITSKLEAHSLRFLSKVRASGVRPASGALSRGVLREAALRGYAPLSTRGSFAAAGEMAVADGEFDPSDERDARRRLMRQIVARQGQPKFRDLLLAAYEGRCAVTGCDAAEALEAAHIRPYLGKRTSVVTNGLLLRADIHTLFDRGLLGIDPTSMTVVVHECLAVTEYGRLAGTSLGVPAAKKMGPSRKALQAHIREHSL